MQNEIAAKLRELARLPDTEAPFLTLYLDTKWTDPNRRSETHIFIKNKVKEMKALLQPEGEAAASFETDVGKIMDYLDHQRSSEVRGLAIFACDDENLWEVVECPHPFENQMLASSRPHLRQLARMLDGYEPVVVCLVDTRSARILEVITGDILKETDLENEVMSRVQVGGWSQMRFQRHVDSQMDRHHKEVADFLTRLVDREGFKRVILLGQDSILSNFKGHLAKRIADKIISQDQQSMTDSKDRILRHVLELLADATKDKEKEIVQRLKDETLSGNLGVIGLEGTLDALRKRQIYMLVVDKDFRANGWKSAAGLLARLNGSGKCPYTHEEPSEVALHEAMLNEALAQGAMLEIVEYTPELREIGGVGALLRYRD